MDCPRELTLQLEDRYLSEYAQKCRETKGRAVEDPDDDVRTAYQRDRDRIIHCNAFRRLQHKTQVFLSPFGDHYRTRLTHTLEVNQIARTLARGMRVNEDLTEAIALGHDLGHTPFGHAGEATFCFCKCKNKKQAIRGSAIRSSPSLRSGQIAYNFPYYPCCILY